MVKLLTILATIQAFIISLLPGTYMKITVDPAVFDCGDCYAVIWETNIEGTGSVTCVKNGVEVTVNDEVSGSLRSEDTVHSVKVDKELLDGSAYTVETQHIIFRLSYSAIKGKSVESKAISFSGYHGQEQINILAVSDVHSKVDSIVTTASNFAVKPDIISLNGDIANDLLNKNMFVDGVLATASRLSHGEIPVIYTRGNHETRGKYSPEMQQYFPTPTGEFYYTFTYGPLYGIVLDTGEDKEDDHVEYSGLVDFSALREREFNWLSSLSPVQAQYHLCFAHIPSLENHFGKNWAQPIIGAGTSLVISGHTHTCELGRLNASETQSCALLIDGNETIATMVTLSGGNRADILSLNSVGETALKENVAIY